MYITYLNTVVLRYSLCVLILIVILCLQISVCHSEVFRGDVVRIADGDTVTVLIENDRKIRVRLLGIDTPELDQAFGIEAREYLAQMILGKPTTCV